jgi:hypothetical protein
VINRPTKYVYTAPMTFFEPLPDPEPMGPHRSGNVSSGWAGPPSDVLPGVAFLDLLLVHSDRQAVWLGIAEAYPSGVVLTVDIRGRFRTRRRMDDGPGTWRFGVQLSNGSKATVHGIGMHGPPGGGAASTALGGGSDASNTPEAVLRPLTGSGSLTSWVQRYWLWPLPPPGELQVACQWPDVEMQFTTSRVDAGALREAANRARVLWPRDGPSS